MRARKIHGRNRKEKKGGKSYNYLKKLKIIFLKRKKSADLPPKKRALRDPESSY